MVKEEKRGVINYELLNRLEGKYGTISNTPNDDEDLRQLRREMNLPEEGMREYRLKIRKQEENNR